MYISSKGVALSFLVVGDRLGTVVGMRNVIVVFVFSLSSSALSELSSESCANVGGTSMNPVKTKRQVLVIYLHRMLFIFQNRYIDNVSSRHYGGETRFLLINVMHKVVDSKNVATGTHMRWKTDSNYVSLETP